MRLQTENICKLSGFQPVFKHKHLQTCNESGYPCRFSVCECDACTRRLDNVGLTPKNIKFYKQTKSLRPVQENSLLPISRPTCKFSSRSFIGLNFIILNHVLLVLTFFAKLYIGYVKSYISAFLIARCKRAGDTSIEYIVYHNVSGPSQ